jgi:starch synthase
MFAWDRLFSGTRTVLTIHNIGHQGTFGAGILAETGLADAVHHFHQDQLREDRLNFLLTGILYASTITTVSPTYAREIQTPEHGVGLDHFLRERRDILFGILNGIDEEEWSPEHDTKIPHRYSWADLSGKERNKQALLTSASLPYFPDVPVIGIVSRLAWQKGFDLCTGVLPRLLSQHRVQLVVLGTGEPKYEDLFATLARRFPRQVAYLRKFSEPVAHLIEAGSDMFLMPSRYEPCGLNQMYSLRYGTPPLVRRTGGLADTVEPWNPRARTGTGFLFDAFEAEALRAALRHALECYRDRDGWRQLMLNGMARDFSWERQVERYVELYRRVAAVPA